MINLTLKDVKEILEQLNYSEIQELEKDSGEYEAINNWGDKRIFTAIYKNGNIVLHADRSISKIMGNHENFQVFEVDFDCEGFTTTVSDYLLKGNSIEDLVPADTPKEKTDMVYNELLRKNNIT